MSVDTQERPPRDNLYRAMFPSEGSRPVELRSAGSGDEGPTMVGHFAVFNEWTEINSIFEGRFMERFSPGAFTKTIKENIRSMRVLFQHGYDPQIGDKPLGPIRSLEEDGTGARYEVPLLDAQYVRDGVLPGLEAGLYGASMRFSVVREEVNEEPERSDHNPEGITERTVKEARVPEFGPVTFPAYEGASAGVRSVTDEFLTGRLLRDPERLQRVVDLLTRDGDLVAVEEERAGSGSGSGDGSGSGSGSGDAPPFGRAGETHPNDGRRDKSEPLYGPGRNDETERWRL